MPHPSDDQLVDVAVGADVPADLSDHVWDCPTCSSTVEELRRTARLVGQATPVEAWTAPPAAVWASVKAQLDAEDPSTSTPPADTPSDSGTDVESEGAGPTPEPAGVTDLDQRRRRRTVAWTGLLVAASLVVGLLAGRAIWSSDGSRPVAQVSLSTLDTRQREGEATVVRAGNGLDLRVVTDRPLDAGNGYLEVWLINADGKRMVSVGVLQPGESGTFPITQTLIDQGYVVVDISKEQFDNNPAHSGDSLLRGHLPA
ncbi:anti-sigma factor [Terrabacter carboxydivorans]|uniref:Anti-sigma K factor RskA C-terminal domain-containing protein n=1 Tax=Terrabacter carboxydivorans TaxID=619730 RepID=A0ABP5Z2B2_9MICO